MDPSGFERRIAMTAKQFPYPETPDLRAGVFARVTSGAAGPAFIRRLAWGMLALLLVASLVTAVVPAARAALVEVIQMGSIRLRLGPDATNAQAGQGIEITWPPDFAGKTTLAEARQSFPYPVRLPSPSTGLGDPDLVFAPDAPAESVILIWLSPDGRMPRLALFELAPSAVYKKQSMTVVERTEVAGQPAIWASGPYLVEIQDGDLAERRLIEGNVLIWSVGELTYRLETGASLPQAVSIAEELK